METYHVGLMGVALVVMLVAVAFVSWRRKVKQQEQILPIPATPKESKTSGSRCFYVATTFLDRPLDRVVAHGLGHRGWAEVSITKSGVVIARVGERELFIPTADLSKVSQSTAVIDKAVERNGLISVAWRLGDTELETHLRFVAQTERLAVLDALGNLIGANK
jgi:hypothetical protein